jgi:ABC-type protease/lipase transport system fused ATPase/permease subunit
LDWTLRIKAVGNYPGLRQRLGIAQGLWMIPILILDDLNGLDKDGIAPIMRYCKPEKTRKVNLLASIVLVIFASV